MTDQAVSIRDAGLATRSLLFKVLADSILAPYHVEEATQRQALLDAIEATAGLTNDELRATPIGALLGAGEAHVGQVGGHTVVASAVPTVSAASAYSSGDVIGTKMTFAGLARVQGGTGLVQMVSLMSKSAQTFSADLVLFHSDPTASTFVDNAAFVVNAADFDKVLGVVSINSWTAMGGPAFAQAIQLAMAYKLPAGQTDCYGVLVSRATPTLTSTSDLKVVVKSLLD